MKNKIKPTSVAQAVNIIMDTMNPKDIKMIQSIPRKDMLKFHHTNGRDIRNEFGLWENNIKLIKDCNDIQKKDYPDEHKECQDLYATYQEKMPYPIHPDDASGVILNELWKTLNYRNKKEKNGKKFKHR